jgi:type IV secretion system protein VirB9
MRLVEVGLFIVLSVGGAAQQSSGDSAPVQAKRLPPGKGKAKPPDQNGAYLDHYDYGAQLVALQDTAPPPANVAPVVPPPAGAAPASPSSEVPAGYRPKTDVQLTQTVQEAVQMSEKWMKEHSQPAVGRDGRILYSFGAGLPTVVCAPLRVCIIELQAGEKLVSEPHIGDSVRWNLSPALYGNGETATSVIVLKPQRRARHEP